MIRTVTTNEYNILKVKFSNIIALYPLVNAVLSCVQNGFVYSNADQNCIIIITKSGFGLFYAENDTKELNSEVFHFLKNNLDIPNYIHLYNPSTVFVDFLNRNWDKFKIRDRIQYRYSNKTYENIDKLLPNNYSIRNIQDVTFKKLSVFNLSFEKRYWDSENDFFKQAIGACIVEDEENPVAICYSACIVDNIAEMDTLVLDTHRGKGFMRIVSLPFFNIANQNEYITHWDTFVSNTPSFELGKKLEPNTINEYKFVSILLR